MRTLLLALLVVGCHTETPSGPDATTWPYQQIPEEAQRPGDPAKGYDYLINGGYITCGIPKTTWDQAMGPAAAGDRLAGRTGDNTNLAYYYSAATSSEGVRVVSANCLTCHAGKINGQLIVGLGAHDRDFTGDQSRLVDAVGPLITNPTEHAEWQRFADHVHAIAPYTQTLTVGVNPADNLTAALMAHRNPATLAWSSTAMLELPPAIVAPVDVPPWWRMKLKHAMFYSGSGRGDHARIMMTASLLCTDTVAEAAAIDQAFVDVRAWIESLEPPKWPFAVDAALAAQGKIVFEASCSKCHGTHGANRMYPNELVPLDKVGTDPLLASGTSQFAAPYVQWFGASFWGEKSRLDPQPGYIAPPLDGIWATAPYFHNGSVPSLALVLDTTKRPMYWLRSFGDYDQQTLGWKFTAMDHGHATETNATLRVRMYDTTEVGYGNGGHDFGDPLTEAERTSLLEYLKTL